MDNLPPTPQRPRIHDTSLRSPSLSPLDSDQSVVFFGEITERERDERLVRLARRETVVPEDMLEALRAMQLGAGQQGRESPVSENGGLVNTDGKRDDASSSSQSSSSPTTPEHSVIVSPTKLPQTAPSRSRDPSLTTPSTQSSPPSPFVPSPATEAFLTSFEAPRSDLSIACLLPLPVSPSLPPSPTSSAGDSVTNSPLSLPMPRLGLDLTTPGLEEEAFKLFFTTPAPGMNSTPLSGNTVDLASTPTPPLQTPIDAAPSLGVSPLLLQSDESPPSSVLLSIDAIWEQNMSPVLSEQPTPDPFTFFDDTMRLQAPARMVDDVQEMSLGGLAATVLSEDGQIALGTLADPVLPPQVPIAAVSQTDVDIPRDNATRDVDLLPAAPAPLSESVFAPFELMDFSPVYVVDEEIVAVLPTEVVPDDEAVAQGPVPSSAGLSISLVLVDDVDPRVGKTAADEDGAIGQDPVDMAGSGPAPEAGESEQDDVDMSAAKVPLSDVNAPVIDEAQSSSQASPRTDVPFVNSPRQLVAFTLEPAAAPSEESLSTADRGILPSERQDEYDGDVEGESDDSVEMGRPGIEHPVALTSSPPPLHRIQMTPSQASFSFTAPRSTDLVRSSSSSFSIPRPPPTPSDSDVSLASILNVSAAFPSTFSFGPSESTDSLDILRQPVPPTDVSMSSSTSSVLVPIVVEPPSHASRHGDMSRSAPPRRSPRLSAAASGSRSPSVASSKLSVPQDASLVLPTSFPSADNLFNITIPYASGSNIFISSPPKRPPIPTLQIQPASRSASLVSVRPAGDASLLMNSKPTDMDVDDVEGIQTPLTPSSSPLPEQPPLSSQSEVAEPSTPKTTPPIPMGSRKSRYTKRGVVVGTEPEEAGEKRAREKEDRKRKRKADAKAAPPQNGEEKSGKDEKENSPPAAVKPSRTASSSHAMKLSSKLANAVAASAAASRSPMRPNLAPPLGLRPRGVSPNADKPLERTKVLKPPTALPKRSALPVPTGIPRPLVKAPGAGVGVKSAILAKTAAAVQGLAGAQRVPVGVTGSPAMQFISSGPMRVPSPQKAPVRSRFEASTKPSASPMASMNLQRPLARTLNPVSSDVRGSHYHSSVTSPPVRGIGSPMRITVNTYGQEVSRFARTMVAAQTSEKKASSPPPTSNTAPSSSGPSSDPPSSDPAPVESAAPAEDRADSTEDVLPVRRMPPRTAKTDSPAQAPKSIAKPAAKSRVPALKKTAAQEAAPRIPALSEAELKSLTAKNTNKNEKYHSQLETITVYRDCPRPPSPSSRIRTVAEKLKEEEKMSRDERAKRRGQIRGESDVDEPDPATQIIERPLKHMRGPGDDEDYSTPAAKRRRVDDSSDRGSADGDESRSKGTRRSSRASVGRGKKAREQGVRWDKALIVPALHVGTPSSSRRTEEKPAKGCLAPALKTVTLDPMGNIPEAGQTPKEVQKQKIKVAKFVYTDDVPEPGTSRKGKKI